MSVGKTKSGEKTVQCFGCGRHYTPRRWILGKRVCHCNKAGALGKRVSGLRVLR